eukprot:2616634-Rhodomonas_salina.5
MASSSDDVWSYVGDPVAGPYGSWEFHNPDCIASGLATTNNTRLFQLLFVSTSQICSIVYLSCPVACDSMLIQIDFCSSGRQVPFVLFAIALIHFADLSLSQSTMCFCQVLFMTTRAPRVTWEAVFLPLVETVLYGLSSSGNGMLRMGDGRVFPFSRMASWLVASLPSSNPAIPYPFLTKLVLPLGHVSAHALSSQRHR